MSGYPAKPSALAFDDTGTLLATGGGEDGDGLELSGQWSRRHAARRSGSSCSTRHERLPSLRGVTRLASGARDGTVAVWSLEKDAKGRSDRGSHLVADVRQCLDLYWRPDGRALAALDAQGGATAWRVSKW